jgi:hypothetical protein
MDVLFQGCKGRVDLLGMHGKLAKGAWRQPPAEDDSQLSVTQFRLGSMER